MSFESLSHREAEERAEALVREIVENYGFPELRVKEAVRVTGASSAQNAINWLLDNGEEDRGGAISLQHCPHTDSMAPEQLISKDKLAFGRPCSQGCSGSENWVCLFCGETLCSRYVYSHCLTHFQETKSQAERSLSVGELARGVPAFGHHLAISLSDLSVWCYECNAYIDPSSGRNPIVAPLVKRMQALKFGTPEQADEHPVLASDVQVGDRLPGMKDALHGSMGKEDWSAPCVCAVANQAARPGYRTCVAHEYLDTAEVLQAKVNVLGKLITKAHRAVAYTGAGISTASGISDYATKSERTSAVASAEMPKLSSPYDAAPTKAHEVLVALHQKGHLDRWVQQNHDGLPQKAGYPQHRLNEIHGAWFDPSNPVVPMDGTLREDLLRHLLDWEQETDLVLALGSTLCGMNADRLCTAAAQRARAGQFGQLGLVIVNLQQTQFDHMCSLRIFARIDDVLLALAKELQLQMPRAPPIPQGDKFEIPYDESGERGGRSTLDLSPGARVRFVRQPSWDFNRAGSVAKVVGRTESGDWELELASDSRRRLGSWWVREALHGAVDYIPVVNLPSDGMVSI
jgi:NAD-dependent SIR2 family protein deacetylase